MGANWPQAKIVATLRGALRGREPGLLVLGLFFLIVFLASLWKDYTLGIVVSLLALVALLVVWLIDHRFTQQTVPINAMARTPGREFSVKMEVDPTRAMEVLATFYETAQNIQPNPDPVGKVQGNPSDRGALQPYSDEEREKIGTAQRREALEHSHKAAEEIMEMQRALMAPTAESTRPARPIPGSKADTP